jgi:hypothetical protein
MWRNRAHGPRGGRAIVPIVFRNAKNAQSSVIAINGDSCLACFPVEVPDDGNINHEVFMSIFVNSILPLCNGYNGDPATRNCVVIMDGATIHMKTLVRAECARKGVLPLFLPPYGYVLNPVELLINASKALMRNKYGLENIYPIMQGRKVGDIFAECVFEMAQPVAMRGFFAHAGVPVPPL